MRIFIGQAFDQELIPRDGLPFAADAFSRNLLSGGGFDKSYTILPTNIRGNLGEVVQDCYELVYSRWRSKSPKFARFSFLIEQLMLFRKIHRNDSIWFYNINYLNFLLFILLALLKPSVKRYVLVMDFTPVEKKWCMPTFFLWLMNKANGTICLSTSKLFTVRNTACLPGVVPERIEVYPEILPPVSADFLLSGAIGENISMYESLLIPAFKQLQECTLHITGIAHDEEKLLRLIGDTPNIRYYGKMPYNDYFQKMHEIPFLLSTRNPAYPENKCNFPSKIIEGLLHNRIVLSTLHYPQLEGIRYLECPTQVDAFVEYVRDMLKRKDILSFANQSNLVRERFSAEVWNQVMTRIEEYEK